MQTKFGNVLGTVVQLFYPLKNVKEFLHVCELKLNCIL